ncbi:MAG: iron-sulfur cluster assembly accessory protein [Holosporaceae bacterium]|jgi:iron-sulfur cluster assembly protein|nr:iron-sulfur cluster assembly accessory protein [Holosporaceae bacterium]
MEEKLINITEAAIDFLKKSVEKENCHGVRLNVVPGGCQGLTYEVDFVKEKEEVEDSGDILVQERGINIYIAARAAIFIAGMTMDYVTGPMGGNLVFNNPNAQSCCGCGKSFCSTNEGTGDDRECGSCCCF